MPERRMTHARALPLALLVMVGMTLMSACVSHGDASATRDTDIDVPGSLANDLAPLARAADAASMLARARERELAVQGERVWVDVQTRELAAEDRHRFTIDGVEVRLFSPKYQRVGAAVGTPGALRALAGLDVVRRVDPEYGYTQ